MRSWTYSLTAALLITVLAAGAIEKTSAENNGIERTPVLGRSSWSFLCKHPTAAQRMAQALKGVQFKGG